MKKGHKSNRKEKMKRRKKSNLYKSKYQVLKKTANQTLLISFIHILVDERRHKNLS
jgi:hypothetical protein